MDRDYFQSEFFRLFGNLGSCVKNDVKFSSVKNTIIELLDGYINSANATNSRLSLVSLRQRIAVKKISNDTVINLLGKLVVEMKHNTGITTQEIKSGVDVIYELNPILTKIGDKQQYSLYLNSIFPNSKIRDIVWHSTDAIIEGDLVQDLSKRFPLVPPESRKKIGSCFAVDRDYSMKYGKNVYGALINAKSPKCIANINRPTNMANIQKLESLKERFVSIFRGKIDSFYGTDYGTSEIVWVVLSPEQIHLLGSEKDITGFKNFIKKLK